MLPDVSTVANRDKLFQLSSKISGVTFNLWIYQAKLQANLSNESYSLTFPKLDYKLLSSCYVA